VFYKHIPMPTKEVFDLDTFVRGTVPPIGAGISKNVTLNKGVVAEAEDLFYPDGRLAGVLVFVPYLQKSSIHWPK